MKIHFFKKHSFYFYTRSIVSKKKSIRDNYAGTSILFKSFCNIGNKQNCGFTCLKLSRKICKFCSCCYPTIRRIHCNYIYFFFFIKIVYRFAESRTVFNLWCINSVYQKICITQKIWEWFIFKAIN